MTEQETVADQEARLRALDPSTSFIVQAPAGSGKTSLLVQRFLVLLAGVDAPEEIVAITFTRKAASEMRQRILEALVRAGNDQPPEKDHEKQTWVIALRALDRDKEQEWQLLDNPARLRVQTIDSLCTALARQMPVLSRFGSLPDIAEDAEPLYLAAARNTISELESGERWSDAVAHLVQHLDNRLDKLQGLISTMLARRDQWLRHVADPSHTGLERENLEAAMAQLVADALRELAKHVPGACVPALIELVRFAANNLEDTDSPIAVCGDLQKLPGVQVTDRYEWEGLAALLLTGGGAWRKSLTKNEGFPPPGSTKNPEEKARFIEMKQRMSTLLKELQDEEKFREQLDLLRKLPPEKYTDDEWETLQVLVGLLRIAAAHLELVFSEHGEVDFPALVQAAIRALGEPEAPTDLALALDYRIRHLLVDEFQDTSFNQYELIKRLTAGWQPEDGHTLFVVGDPMQSIYRFREAEVGLFLAATEQGIGQVPLEFLRLTVNFRSQQGIVNWINQHFPNVLPTEDNVTAGAVSYAPSTPYHPQLDTAAVTVHPSLIYPLSKRDDLEEARRVVEIVEQAKQRQPDGKIAILVRGRTHLVQIVEQLQEAGLRFQAVEIERLAHRPVVQDLLALTRALNHIGDRIAWLAVLRAPYCGLTLKDLHTLAGGDLSRPIFDLLQQEERIEQLSEDGQGRIGRVLPVLDTALSEQSRGSLRSYVEGVWMALGGPACLTDKTDLEDAEVYFQLLEKLGSRGEVPGIHELNIEVDQLFSLPDVEADGSLQLMTIHRAKGLEFDTVIVPGLGRSPRRDDTKLLHWTERGRVSGARESDERNLLLAPIGAVGEDKNPMSAYLQLLADAKGHFEDSRLLYVASTRAKEHLHLLGHIDVKEGRGRLDLRNPRKDSLLARLWPVVESNYQSLLDERGMETPLPEEAIAAGRTQVRTRLALDWAPPAPPESVRFTDITLESEAGKLPDFDWAGETARHVGTAVHRLLQNMVQTGIDDIEPGDLHRFAEIARNMLVRSGVPVERLDVAVDGIIAGLNTMLEDERGQWILGRHEQANCELALTGLRDGAIDHMVIDRTFVDDDGIRWIIDYKTGSHKGGDVDEFLDQEQERYRQQLERYANAMSKMEERPIRLGLYFPLLGRWREWAFQ